MRGNESTFLQPAACVLSLFGRGKLREQSDLVFHCSDGKVSSHRLLLAAMSSYLAELLLSVEQELLPAVILLPGVSRVALAETLTVLCTTGAAPRSEVSAALHLLSCPRPPPGSPPGPPASQLPTSPPPPTSHPGSSAIVTPPIKSRKVRSQRGSTSALARHRTVCSHNQVAGEGGAGEALQYHLSGDGLTCGDCGRRYSSRGACRLHWRSTHSGLRPHECDQCGATFSRKDSYVSHLTMHSNSQPFLCSECGKRFNRRHARDQHERCHRKDFRFGCRHCPKLFLSGQQRRNHERTHTGEKPHVCVHEGCGRSFAQKHQLVTHTRIHTGERPYQCDKCRLNFKHLSSKRNHRCQGGEPIKAGIATAAAAFP